MKDFFLDLWEKIKKEWRETLKNFGVKVKEKESVMTEQKTDYEVSLVPEVKRQMIKTMKIRNIFLFVCIVLVSVAGGTVLIMTTIWSGQNITMSGQDKRMESMSSKLNDYDSLGEFLTIQDQLDKINQVNTNKKVLSRVFSILGVVLPTGPDTISISDLTVNMATDSLRFDAQADAKVSPYIDYRVLESFKKGVSLMKYDYGRYVTADGDEIPTRCMVETDVDGNTLVEEETSGLITNRYIYAYWLKGKKGCDPKRDDMTEEEEDEEETAEAEATQTATVTSQSFLNQFTVTQTAEEGESAEKAAENSAKEAAAKQQKIKDEYDKKLESMNDYEKQLADTQLQSGAKMENIDVVKIYRSPRFSDWYEKGYIDEGGTITGIQHFESQCITYSGEDSTSGMKWTATNDCMLATEEPVIQDSSNGRNSNGDLVLRFTALMTLDPAVFMFENKHVMAISPSGQNVTDSYRQIEGMFEQRAADCSDSDVVCTTTSTKGDE